MAWMLQILLKSFASSFQGGEIYKVSAEAREALLRVLSPIFVDRTVPRIADAFQALVPIAEEKVKSSQGVNLAGSEPHRVPKLLPTPVPMETSDFDLVNSLQQQKPWRWVKITQENVGKGLFSLFEEVSSAEIEMAEAKRQFL